MEIKGLKLENVEYHNYFVHTVYNILNELGFGYTIEEVDEMSVKENYRLHFHNEKTKKWHFGIWAVGEWGVKEQIDDKVINCGYGIDSYKPLTLSVFLIHEWMFDKFRPTYSDWETLIGYKENTDKLISELRYTFKNSISSYYNIIDEDDYNFQHHERNKYIAYFKGWFYNDFGASIRQKRRRWCGWLFTKIITLIALCDKRVEHREYKFYKDKWNAEYNIAIVFRYGETEWHDWKRWNDYNRIYKRFRNWCDWNISVDFTYLDEDGNMPKNIWRGVYWEEEPEK